MIKDPNYFQSTNCDSLTRVLVTLHDFKQSKTATYEVLKMVRIIVIVILQGYTKREIQKIS